MAATIISQPEKEKRKKLRQIDRQIARADDYDELVKLVKIYNRVRDEN